MSNSVDKKKQKRQGPIRFEAIVPIGIIIALVVAYFTLFFDHHLKKAIEWGVGKGNGAEVNVGSLQTSFLHASFLLKDLQITDPEAPQFNRLQLGEIRTQLLWDGLLRGKFVVADASIMGIQIHSPRKNPGRVFPKKEEPKPENAGPSQVALLGQDALKHSEAQFKGNALGDIASLLGGADPTAKLNDITSQLASVAKVNELEKQIKEKQKYWQDKLQTLPDSKAIDALKARIQAVQLPKDLKDTNQLKSAGEQIQSILKDSDSQFKQINEVATGLSADLNSMQASIKGIDELARQDVKNIEKRVQLPQMDPKEIAKSLFMRMLFAKLGQYGKYVAMARQYMPAGKADSKGKKEVSHIEPSSRAGGRTYQFGKPHGYPLFWLQHSAISSVATANSPLTGNLKGELKDLNTDPPLIGKPTTLELAGDFPAQQWQGLQAKIVIDHTTDNPVETLKASVASFPVGNQSLSDSEQVKLAIAKASAESVVNAQLKGGELDLAANTVFTQVAYDINAQNEVVSTTLKEVLKDISRVTLNTTAQGPLSDLRLDINSNLGEALRKGFERQLQKKIDEARAQIQAVIDKNLKGKKEELTAQFNQTQSQLKGSVDEKKSKIDETKKLGENKSKEAQNAGKNQLQEAGKKGLEDLKKKFGF